MKDLIELIQAAQDSDAIEKISKDNKLDDLREAAVSEGIEIADLTTKILLTEAIHAAKPSVRLEEDEEDESVPLSEKVTRRNQLIEDIKILKSELVSAEAELKILVTPPEQKSLSQHALLCAVRKSAKEIEKENE